MDGGLFYIVGGALVLAALVLSAIGIRRRDSFPRSGKEMAGVLVLFAVIVAGTAAYSVANAREEEQHRNDELAEEEAEAAEEVAKGEQAEAPPGGGAPAGGAAPAPATIDLTSPEDGSLVFDPESLEAAPGTITLAYDNPSAVPHSVAIQDEEDQVLAESDVVSQALTEATADLVPGSYIYFCTVPGHRESGMEGVLTVQ
jgi:plastocyanin